MANDKQRTAGGLDRKTASGTGSSSKGQQDQAGTTGQQGGASGSNRQGKDGGASPQSGSAPRSTGGGGTGAGKR